MRCARCARVLHAMSARCGRRTDGLVPETVLDGLQRSLLHRLERVERRFLAGVKRREFRVMHQIATARGALYPHGAPQERKPGVYCISRAVRVLAARRDAHGGARSCPRGAARGSAAHVGCGVRGGRMTLPAADEPTPMGDAPARRSATGALFVSIGIFATKMFGIVRQVVIAHFLGASVVADAFNAAFRIPNLLQNLFGEGALSAAFIPVYSNLLARGAQGDRDATEEAGRVAGAVLAILALLVSILVLLGVLFTPQILPLIAAGFKGRKRALAITYVRILFPGAGLFVMSAWCLGVLNSHRKFLLSYAAPVVWNLAIIVALLVLGKGENLTTLGRTAAWASVVGAGAQFLVQVPFVLRLVPQLRVSLDFARAERAHGAAKFWPRGRESRGRAAQRLYRPVDLVIPAGRNGLAPVLRHHDLVRAGEHVRNRHLGGGAARDVERDR